jgi:hypothetical protein
MNDEDPPDRGSRKPPSQLSFLPFDRADYGPHDVPCQLLAATFNSAGLHYHVELDVGVRVSVAKKQLQALMSAGIYATVIDCVPVRLPGASAPSLGIRLSRTLTKYVNAHSFALPPNAVKALLGTEYDAPRTPGKRLAYRFEESTRRGNNLSYGGVE